MTEHMVRYMQKMFYEGLTEKDILKSNAMLEGFNNNGVFMEDEKKCWGHYHHLTLHFS